MRRYNPVLIDRAREMRRNPTAAEKVLWFRCLRLQPVNFRRQRPFGPYIVDFYCPLRKLVIELDGDSHFSDEGKVYDEERTRYLESLGLRVVRFTNDDVSRNFAGVTEKIAELVNS